MLQSVRNHFQRRKIVSRRDHGKEPNHVCFLDKPLCRLKQNLVEVSQKYDTVFAIDLHVSKILSI